MSMVKVIAAGSQDLGAAAVSMVKLSSHGLTGGDRQRFVKRASDRLAAVMDHLEFAPGEVPIHLIAVGATEKYACNRNGDGFREAICQQYHPTFVKHARFYRDHKNKDPQKSYGIVKYSEYNPAMSRIELIVALNSTEEAASRNGGLLADREMEKLASGTDIGVSMACGVPFDVCSGCENNAPTRADYCTPQMCKYGGLRDNMGRVFDDGHILHADNTQPTFFDISHVWRPADRIAYVTGRLEKAAAHEVLYSGAALAEEYGITVPDFCDTGFKDKYSNMVRKLAAVERHIEQSGLDDRLKAAYHGRPRNIPSFKAASSRELPDIIAACCSHGVMPVLSDFLKVAANVPEWKLEVTTQRVATALPGIYSRMLRTEKQALAAIYAPPVSQGGRWSRYIKEASEAAVTPAGLRRRVWESVARGDTIPRVTKYANTDDNVEDLATHFAMFKAAILANMPVEMQSQNAIAATVVPHYFAG